MRSCACSWSCLVLALAASACDDERFSHEQLLAGCTRRLACGVMPYARLKDCASATYELHRPQGLGRTYAEVYRCVNDAGGSCPAIRACFGIRAAEPACDASFTATCAGAEASSCDLLTHTVYRLDCAAAELSCGVPQPPAAQFEARCTTGSCSPGEPSRCAGDRLLSCINGLWESTACDARGLTCEAPANEPAGCVGGGGPCQAADQCAGQTAIRCVGGREARQHCPDYPLTSGCRDGRCVPAGAECLDQLDRCQGEALESCLDGRWVRQDCHTLGLGPCVPSPQGAHCGER